jgi:UDP-N-acetylmuramate-alanine ligase
MLREMGSGMDVLAICGSPGKKGTTNSVLTAVLAGTGRPYEILKTKGV